MVAKTPKNLKAAATAKKTAAKPLKIEYENPEEEKKEAAIV